MKQRGVDAVMKPLLVVISLLALLAGLASLWTLGSRGPESMPGPSVDVLLDLDLGAEGFGEVVEDRPLRFPADHGAHPEYRGAVGRAADACRLGPRRSRLAAHVGLDRGLVSVACLMPGGRFRGAGGRSV